MAEALSMFSGVILLHLHTQAQLQTKFLQHGLRTLLRSKVVYLTLERRSVPDMWSVDALRDRNGGKEVQLYSRRDLWWLPRPGWSCFASMFRLRNPTTASSKRDRKMKVIPLKIYKRLEDITESLMKAWTVSTNVWTNVHFEILPPEFHRNKLPKPAQTLQKDRLKTWRSHTTEATRRYRPSRILVTYRPGRKRQRETPLS